MKSIRVGIADDSDLMLVGIESALAKLPNVKVLGRARSLPALLTLLQHQALDVVILNAWLYNSDVFGALAQIQAVAPQIKCVVIGSTAEGTLIQALLRAGVAAYLYHSDDLLEALPNALYAIQRGRLALSPTPNAEYLTLREQPTPSTVTLTPQAHQILRLLAEGHPVGEIARRVGTTKRYIYRIRYKLRQHFGATTNEHLIRRAVQEGWILLSD